MNQVCGMAERAFRILMIEDNMDDVEIVRAHLRQAGLNCCVERVDTGCSLENALLTQLPVAVLCDLHLPALPGLEALEIVQRVAPDIPFMFFSGSVHGPTADAGTRGNAMLLSKDNCRHIVEALRKLLASQQTAIAPHDDSTDSATMTADLAVA